MYETKEKKMTPEEHLDKEYQMHASELIFGIKTTKEKGYGVYKIIKTNVINHLNVYESTQLDNSIGSIRKTRRLNLTDDILITTSSIEVNDLAKIIVLHMGPKTSMDAIFSDTDLRVLEGWGNLQINRVEKLGLLIKILNEKSKDGVPLLMAEFPNICGFIIHNLVDESWK